MSNRAPRTCIRGFSCAAWRAALLGSLASLLIFASACGGEATELGLGDPATGTPKPAPTAMDYGAYSTTTAAKLVRLAMSGCYSDVQKASAAAQAVGYTFVSRLDRDGLRADLYRETQRQGGPLVVAFRGTSTNGLSESYINIATDLDGVNMRTLDGDHHPGKVHAGFLNGLDTLWRTDAGQGLQAMLQAQPERTYVMAGHSLGGAMATLAAIRVTNLVGSDGEVLGVYTFGSPRVGNEEFRAAYDARFGARHQRVCYAADFVAHMAPSQAYERDKLGLGVVLTPFLGSIESYVHVGQFRFLTEPGTEHPATRANTGEARNTLLAAWQSRFEAVIDDEGLVDAIKQMGAEHMGYEQALPLK